MKKQWGYAWDPFADAGYQCEYCDLDVAITGDWDRYSMDHLVPCRVINLPNGVAGPTRANDPLNLVCACDKRNHLKGRRDLSAGAAVPTTVEERARLVNTVRDYLSRRRQEREVEWAADVTALLAVKGRVYRPAAVQNRVYRPAA